MFRVIWQQPLVNFREHVAFNHSANGARYSAYLEEYPTAYTQCPEFDRFRQKVALLDIGCRLQKVRWDCSWKHEYTCRSSTLHTLPTPRPKVTTQHKNHRYKMTTKQHISITLRNRTVQLHAPYSYCLRGKLIVRTSSCYNHMTSSKLARSTTSEWQKLGTDKNTKSYHTHGTRSGNGYIREWTEMLTRMGCLCEPWQANYPTEEGHNVCVTMLLHCITWIYIYF